MEEMPEGVSQEERDALKERNESRVNEIGETSQPMLPQLNNHESGHNMMNPNMMPTID